MIQDQHIFKCPTIRRGVAADAYKPACLEEMKADFYEYIRRGAMTTRLEVHKGGGRRTEMPKPGDRKAAPRSVRIREEDLEQLGFTAGCPGCAWYSDKLGPHRGHTAECRKRIEEAMHETEQGKMRMDIAKAKKDKHDKTKLDDDDDVTPKDEGEEVPPEGER